MKIIVKVLLCLCVLSQENLATAVMGKTKRHDPRVMTVSHQKIIAIAGPDATLLSSLQATIALDAPYIFSPGLRDIAVCTTQISFIDGVNGRLFYCGHDITQLVTRFHFAQIVYLLLHGAIPAQSWKGMKIDCAHLSGALNWDTQFAAIPQRLIRRQPMAGLQSLIPTITIPDSLNKIDSCYFLMHLMPWIIGTMHRASHGTLGQMEIKITQNYAQNLLYAMTGKDSSQQDIKIMDILLSLHAEHGVNASTFSVRSQASAKTDVLSAITAGIGMLSGARHGGASFDVIAMLEELIAQPDLDGAIKQRIDLGAGRIEARGKVPLPGVGHRVYKAFDPRALVLKRVVQQIATQGKSTRLINAALKIEAAVLSDPYYSARKINPNVDFYSGIIYLYLGINKAYIPLMFVNARLAGWLAHYYEELKSGLPIMRPRSVYQGLVDVSKRRKGRL